MPPTTPPKGRPTPGKIDRERHARVAARRQRRVRLIWAIVAVAVVAAVIVLGSGSGSGPGGTPTSPL